MSSSDIQFAKGSILDILVPEETDLNIEDALRSSGTVLEAEDVALITSVPQRSLLFFDERVTVYLVLRTPCHDELSLKNYISRLAIGLEAHAISSAPAPNSTGDGSQGSASSQTRDVIWSEKLDVNEDPLMVMEETEDGGVGQEVLLIWKLVVFLSRPRVRLNAPAILFKISGSLQPPQPSKVESTDPYLPSAVPLPANLLQPLQDDLALKGIVPSLSSQRLSRTAPPSGRPTRPETLPLRAISRKAFRAIPAISSRMKYHKAHTPTGTSSVIATLELEMPAFAQHTLDLHAVDLKLADGSAHALVDSFKLPKKCQPRDNIVCLYSLTPGGPFGETESAASHTRSLDISIDAMVLVSEACHPCIEIRWKATVDFSPVLNSVPGKPGNAVPRKNRPTSLSTPTTSTFNKNSLTVSHQPTASNDLSFEASNSSSSADFGIMLTFTALGDVYVGEPFRWSIFIVNRSEKARRLAITVVPWRKRSIGKVQGSRPPSASSAANIVTKPGKVADAFINENLLHAIIKAHSVEATQLVCLTTDIKIGPLNPGACYATDLLFLPLAKGLLFLEAIRISDLTSNETVDVRDLPDIMAVERTSTS